MNRRIVCAALTFGLLGTAVAPVLADGGTNSSKTSSLARLEPRSLATLRTDLRQSLRDEALTRSQGDNGPQVRRLIDLYQEMADHPARDQSVTLKRLGLRLRSRLVRVAQRLQDEGDAAQQSASQPAPGEQQFGVDHHILAQQIGLPIAGAVGQAVGLPAAPLAAPNVRDFGPDLVEVIQHTISPETWNIHGGQGAVVYFAPRRAVVVSAPDHVHEEVGDVIRQLRGQK